VSFPAVSGRWASAQVRHASRAELLGDVSQPLATGREEAALQIALEEAARDRAESDQDRTGAD